jgi:hypothetical protein
VDYFTQLIHCAVIPQRYCETIGLLLLQWQRQSRYQSREGLFLTHFSVNVKLWVEAGVRTFR